MSGNKQNGGNISKHFMTGCEIIRLMEEIEGRKQSWLLFSLMLLLHVEIAMSHVLSSYFVTYGVIGCALHYHFYSAVATSKKPSYISHPCPRNTGFGFKTVERIRTCRK